MTRVLIVEDTEESRYLLEYALSAAGHQVSTAAHGAEALEVARRDSPDIVVSDILMPVMDGFTLCREWRADPALQDIPFMFYTATYTDAQDEQLALDLGADRFVRKPQDPAEIVTLVQELLSARPDSRPVKPRDLPPLDATVMAYNGALVRKLDAKVAALEATRRLLEAEKAELERWQQLTLGREDRVQELKQEVNELCRELGRAPRYDLEQEP